MEIFWADGYIFDQSYDVENEVRPSFIFLNVWRNVVHSQLVVRSWKLEAQLCLWTAYETSLLQTTVLFYGKDTRATILMKNKNFLLLFQKRWNIMK